MLPIHCRQGDRVTERKMSSALTLRQTQSGKEQKKKVNTAKSTDFSFTNNGGNVKIKRVLFKRI